MKLIIAVLVLVALLSVDAKRAKGKKLKGVPSRARNVVTWTQVLLEQGAQQAAYIIEDNPDAIWLGTTNKRGLKQQGYTATRTVFDFSGDDMVAVMKIKKGCYRLPGWPSNTTKQSFLNTLNSMNGTTKASTAPTEYYASDMDQEIFLTHLGVSTLCGRVKPIQDLTTSSAGLGDAKTFLVATLSNPPVSDQLSVVVPSKARAGKGRKGKKNGSRQGGKKNKKAKKNN